MNVYGKSDMGLKRSTNQDCFAMSDVDENVLWAVVCDGMGGANGGNIASNLAVSCIKDNMLSNCNENISEVVIKDLLIKTINKANSEIYNKAQADQNLVGMGTTVVLALAFYDKVHIAHVGDSRAYILRNGSIRQITVDHSVVQKMVDDGEITWEEARTHPNKNIITRALGICEDVEVDYHVEEFDSGDVVIICTDGLTNHLNEADILNCVKRGNAQAIVIDELIEEANKDGGTDNITVVMISKVNNSEIYVEGENNRG